MIKKLNADENMKCLYQECFLPENNHRYGWQFLYLTFSWAYLIMDPLQFTFFPIVMFVVPTLIDLFSLGPLSIKGKQAGVIIFVKWLYIVINILIFIVSVCGLMGLITDNGTYFMVTDTAILFAGSHFSKKIMSAALFADIIVPGMLYKGMPNKQAMRAAEKVREKVAS